MASNEKQSFSMEPDPFDEIFLSEEKAERAGYEEGYEAGRKKGLSDGYDIGYKEGEGIGEEIGFYLGFGSTWVSLLRQEEETKRKDREKITKVLLSFVECVKEFPVLEVELKDYMEKLKQIRAQYRQVSEHNITMTRIISDTCIDIINIEIENGNRDNRGKEIT
ncbi:PREDICTED: oral cancer-overexpressed protein 1 homolog isoform X1 [Amphimedon queenslandica]|uniref:Essential protein Yae1 N-terminal domain-containing protein n=1 Tax=Amphimedon queenslandica TaxID=400682 RepID=A0AAN0IUR4_AMPQE|nr:PREDICTED: oral cancer-overexpressed protein 1 homolog isoform X1 [Amphimedon queenslandica]|eukprot:XP_011409835.1 PREDICTED: oral cancer-overexpressed protein 1 homolog isoform X1 [Amphimedon queenslandica]